MPEYLLTAIAELFDAGHVSVAEAEVDSSADHVTVIKLTQGSMHTWHSSTYRVLLPTRHIDELTVVQPGQMMKLDIILLILKRSQC